MTEKMQPPKTHKALIQPKKESPTFELKLLPTPTPGPNQLLVRVRAVAINPVDWLIQTRGSIIFSHIKYPFVLGIDLAGEVVDVGSNISTSPTSTTTTTPSTSPSNASNNVKTSKDGFSKGDRILAMARGGEKSVNDPRQGAFQEYVLINPSFAAHIPPSVSYEEAAALPLAIGTAATGLFDKDTLALETDNLLSPSGNPIIDGKNAEKKNTKGTVIIHGASTSVGANAVQLASLAGYNVLTTSSPHNFPLLKSIGATRTFDYRSKTITQDLIAAAAEFGCVAGGISLANGGGEILTAVLASTPRRTSRTGEEIAPFIALGAFPVVPDPKRVVSTLSKLVAWMVWFKVTCWRKGLRNSFFTPERMARTGLAGEIYGRFLPRALADRTFKSAPPLEVVGSGLEAIAGALKRSEAGVSGRKIVVTL